MAEKVRVAVDAMGGDNAPGEIVKGAVDAVNSRDDIEIILTGRQDQIEAELVKYTYGSGRIRVIHCEEVIETAEPPVQAISGKKDSSMVVGMNLVKRGEADAIVSAGNSGALLVGGQTVIGRIRGVERPALAPLIPTEDGAALLIDAGANVDARPSHLVQFAQMGSIYMEDVIGVRQPRTAVLNIGAEEEKGNALVRETYPLLQSCEGIRFTGSIEAREIPHGGADVIVCDGFAGNIVLKLYEGLSSTLLKKVKQGMMSSLRSKVGALLIQNALRETLRSFDVTEYGGAPLLGCKGLLVKTHGSASANDVKNSIIQCVTFKQQGINDRIREHIGSR